MKFHWRAMFLLIALASCGPRREPHQSKGNSAAPILPPPSAPSALTNEATAAKAPEQQNRAELIERKGPIDPRSVEAAGEVVHHYGALIEEKRFIEAASLWGDAGSAASFAKQLDHPQVHLEIGTLGETEGAAGSIYTSVPVIFYGEGFRRAASVILRRVNDVPGSTETERRWHIEQIEWDKAP